MPDTSMQPRGARARAERRRIRKAERRQLEAASAPLNPDTSLFDATATEDADAGTVDARLRVDVAEIRLRTRSKSVEASAESGGSGLEQTSLVHGEASRVGPTGQVAGPVRTGLIAGIQRGGEITVLVGASQVAAQLSRDLLQDKTGVAVGDRVKVVRGKGDVPTVVEVEPRQTRLARIREDRTRRSEFGRQEVVLAANVDIAVIVAAVTQPAFHPKLVDRFLVICQYGGIRPVLCLNKCDLVDAPPDVSVYQQLGLPIVYASAATGAGLDELRSLLRGTIAVFTGHSGVGKSSLANALLGDTRQIVGSVRGADGRGRHTTTWSTLLHWDDDSYVVDTPGIRSVGIWKIDPAALAGYFPDFDAFGPFCRFSGCSHTHEPACAIKSAVEDGWIARPRYESYLRMMDA